MFEISVQNAILLIVQNFDNLAAVNLIESLLPWNHRAISSTPLDTLTSVKDLIKHKGKKTTLRFSLMGFRSHRLEFVFRWCACLSHLGKLVEFGQVVWPSVYSRWRVSGRPVRLNSSPPPPSVRSAAPPEQTRPCNFRGTIQSCVIKI